MKTGHQPVITDSLNFQEDEACTATVEDGSIAKLALDAYRAALSAPAQDAEQYRWLIECARKTGITMHFQGDALVIGHGYSKGQNERDILDAERYRWLRSMIFDDSIIVARDRMLHGPKLDEAVDAAIAKDAGT